MLQIVTHFAPIFIIGAPLSFNLLTHSVTASTEKIELNPSTDLTRQTLDRQTLDMVDPGYDQLKT